MHGVIKKALTTFEQESKLPPDQKKPALYWLEVFCGTCLQQKEDEITQSLSMMLEDRLLSTIASWVKWKFTKRGKLSKRCEYRRYYGYSLGICIENCPLCVWFFYMVCLGCPVEKIKCGCRNTGSPYQTAVYIGRKTPLVNALWEAVEWAIKYEE